MSHRLYTDLAWLWPLVSPVEDYRREARHVLKLLRGKPPRARLRPPSKPRLLELGTGGGHLLHHVAPAFDAAAVDLSPAMLALARRLNPGVEHHVGDMRTVRLGQTFDAVLLHDAVHYMLTEADLRAALTTAAAHLSPLRAPPRASGGGAGSGGPAGKRGVVIVMPTHVRETFVEHAAEHGVHADGGVTVDHFAYAHDPDPADTTFELTMLFLLRDHPRGTLQVEEDRHTCGLFPISTWLRLLDEAGFDAELHRRPKPSQPGGHGATPIFLGLKRTGE